MSKVVREHYLRDDISCGSASCASCAAPEAGAPLSAGPGVTYLVVDTNVVLHQLDLLEHASVANVVLPSVALEEARKRNHAAYTRARAIASTSDRHFYVFANENHRDTFVEASQGWVSLSLVMLSWHSCCLWALAMVSIGYICCMRCSGNSCATDGTFPTPPACDCHVSCSTFGIAPAHPPRPRRRCPASPRTTATTAPFAALPNGTLSIWRARESMSCFCPTTLTTAQRQKVK